MKIAILIANDAVYSGNREDPDLGQVSSFLEERGDRLVYTGSVPESRDMVEMELEKLCDQELADVLLTIGGTGFSVRDCLPEATRAVRDREHAALYGLLQDYCREVMKHGMLYRTETGFRKNTLIINLPGSGNILTQCLEILYDRI